jgi:DNA-binding MarR family transcriptional regulator
MKNDTPFSLQDFMPYLLNRAAEATSLEFQKYYKARYGMLRTEWRVLFHLGRYGNLTAKAICDRASIHKTKVSRAVAALENRRFLTRENLEGDRRHDVLSLTKSGQAAFDDLVLEAERYNDRLARQFTEEDYATVRRFLLQVGKVG